MDNKGNIGKVLPIITVVVLSVIMITIGLRITGDMKGDMTAGSMEYNATNNSMQALTEIADWGDLIGLVAAAGIILLIIFGVLVTKFKGNY